MAADTTDYDFSQALKAITETLIPNTHKIFDIYKKNDLVISPDGIIKLYCQFLSLVILGSSAVVNKHKIYYLITETLSEHYTDGAKLYHLLIERQNDKQEGIKELILGNGLIVVNIITLVQYLLNMYHRLFEDNIQNQYTPNQLLELENSLTPAIHAIFADTAGDIVQKLQELNIAKPLYFFLENFSIILGWLAGFFANINRQPVEIFMEESLEILAGLTQEAANV